MRLVSLATAGAALLTALPTAASPPPGPPFVHYLRPSRSQVTATYQCPGFRIRLEIEAGDGPVRVVRHEGAAGPTSEADLALWNEALAGLTGFVDVSAGCQSGGHETITIRGQSAPGERLTAVRVWLADGRLGVLSPAPSPRP